MSRSALFGQPRRLFRVHFVPRGHRKGGRRYALCPPRFPGEMCRDAPHADEEEGLPPGTPAPDFTLPASDGPFFRLSDLRSGWLALYFLRGTWFYLL